MLHVLSLAALVLGAPYQNFEDHFAMDLPAGWVVAGTSVGQRTVVLQRKEPDGIAMAVIRTLPFESGLDARKVARRLGEALQAEGGFRVVAEELDALGAMPCVKRRYSVWVNRDPSLVKVIEERVAQAGERFYAVHVEALDDDYGRFAEDFRSLFRSFRATGEGAQSASAPAETAAPDPAVNRELVGHWRGGGHFLVMTASGTVVLDAIEGSYVAKEGVLLLMLRGRDPLQLKYRVHKGSLVVSGGELGAALQMINQWEDTQP